VWWRRAIERRLSAVVVMAFVLWIALTAAAAVLADRRITQLLADERTIHARQAAAAIERELENELRALDRIAAVLERGSDPVATGAAVRTLTLSDVVLHLSPGGDVRSTWSVRDGALRQPIVRSIPPNAGKYWRAHPTDLLHTADGPRACLLLPTRESDPQGGALAASLRPGGAWLARVAAPYREHGISVVLLDSREALIGGSDDAGPPSRESLIASSAVPRTSWTVQLRQPRAKALATLGRLPQVLVGGSVALAAVAVLMAWGAARSIRQPVERLTSAAERLTHGALEEPITAQGEDEIARLGHALEHLRRALQDDERRSVLLRRVLSVQEDERRRIARELHDETTQQLTALALKMDTASRDPSVATALGPARQIVNTLIDGLHRVIYDLRPSVLDDLGLLPAIRTYARTHLEPRGVSVHCEFPDDLPDLAPDATTAVYRVVQEALTNVMRHAGAEAVQVACAVAGDTLVIEVEDDGAGFDPRSVSNPRKSGQGLGLLGMRERMALLGGRVEIDAAPGSGTRVTVSLPLTSAVLARAEVPA
jgi:signal transduction histidine kinase